jgi:MoaA/NifB/PqqE/SkfB family radical SAM enzyme
MIMGTEDKKNIFEETESICPVCRKVVGANIVEDNGSLWMEKSCESHGFFRVKVAKYAWYYKELNRFYNLICPGHLTQSKKNTKFYFFYPTMNCNLHCPVCFSNSGGKAVNSDIPLGEVRDMVSAIKEPRRIISLLGGEPTVNDNLPEIIRIIIKAGHIPGLFTNGIKLADIGYLRKLKECGLKNVSLSLDALEDDSVYEKLRGVKLISVKKMVLDNIKTLNMNVRIFFTLVRGINEGEIARVFEFVQKNSFVHHLEILGYVCLGRKGFSAQEEFTMDEIVEIICKETNNFITLDEFFLFQKIFYAAQVLFLNNPVCYRQQFSLIPRNNNKKIREIFDCSEFSRYLDRFEVLYKESPLKAKAYFLEKIFVKVIKCPGLLSTLIKQAISPNLHNSNYFKFQDNNYFRLQAGVEYTPYSYDIRYTAKRCLQAWLPSYKEKELTNFCTVIGRH